MTGRLPTSRPSARCLLCGDEVPSHDLLGHLRVLHPALFGGGPELWPDGGPVIEDEEISVETLLDDD